MATKKATPPPLVERLALASVKPVRKSARLDSLEPWPDGRSVLLASGFEGVWREDLATGALLATYRDERRVTCWMARVSRDGARVVSAFGDQMLRVWDAASGRETASASTPGIVTRISLSADGATALTASANKTVCLWDLAAGRALCTLDHKKSWAVACALGGGGSIALFGGADGVLRAAALPSGAPLWTRPDPGWLEAIDVTADGRVCACTGRGKAISLVEAATGALLRVIPLSANASFVALSPDGRFVLALAKGPVLLFEAASGVAVATVPAPEEITAARFSADSRTLVIGDKARTVRLFDLPA